MKIAISQPTFLPWHGYFGLIDYVDEFVFLENIQFDKRSWQQRNRLRNKNESYYISIPVSTKGKRYQNICDVEIFYEKNLASRILNNIQVNYKNTPYYKNYYYDLSNIFLKENIKLSLLNKELILFFCKILNIKTKISSDLELNINSKKIEYLRDISIKKNATTYITTLGSKDYLKDLFFFPSTSIEIKYFTFSDLKYKQIDDNFISKLSILDLIFNIGPNSLSYIRKCFKIIN
jgi:hypothetical protein